MGSAVLNVDNNLRLIFPPGTLPLNSTSSEGTSVLTPITQVCLSAMTGKTLSVPAQMYRSTAPLLIPAAARRPSQSYSVVSVPSATSKTPCQPAMKVTVLYIFQVSVNWVFALFLKKTIFKPLLPLFEN